MTVTNVSKTTPKAAAPKNGSPSAENTEQAAATTSPAESKADTRAITVVLPEMLARQLRVVCNLRDESISDTVAGLVQAHVKQKLPGLLAGLDASFP